MPPKMRGFDTADSTEGIAHIIASKFRNEDGTQAQVVAGLYLRKDRTTLSEIEGLFSVQDTAGNGVFSLVFFHENGYPTTPDYFTDDQAKINGEAILTLADYYNFPKEMAIFDCADYDSKIDDLDSYLRILHGILYPENRYLGLYGNWTCINHFKNTVADDNHNVIHAGILSQSTGFKPYPNDLSVVDAWQGPTVKICGMDCDEENVNNLDILWRP
jgi:hypothetical protein